MSEDEARTLEALLGELRAFPAELRHARWLLKERQEYLDGAKRESDGLLESARVQAERMVERSDIVREARHSAQEVLADAEAEARRLHHQAEDYVDLPEPEPVDEDEVPVFDQDGT